MSLHVILCLSRSEASCIFFLRTGFPGVGISWCVFEHHTFRVLFFYTQDSRENPFSYVFLSIRLFSAVPRGPPLPLLNMNTTLLSSLMTSGRYSAPPRVLFFYTQDSRETGFRLCFFQNAALAEALASFSGFRSFRIVFPLQRWPHFRASARSESCSRCSAGPISAPLVVPKRARAAAPTFSILPKKPQI